MAQLSKYMLETVFIRYKNKIPLKDEVDAPSKKVSPTRLKFSIKNLIDSLQDALEKIRGK